MSISPTETRSRIAERPAPTPEAFRREVVPARQPMVLRGVAGAWPLVTASRRAPHAAMALLARHASNAVIDVLRADPAEEGRFHYGPDGQSLNFIRGRGNLAGLVAALREQEAAPQPFAIAAQGLIAERHVPGFARAHPMPLAPPSAEPRLWIGNAAKVATHSDPVDNLAVVAAGRRRFTCSRRRPSPTSIWGRGIRPRRGRRSAGCM